MPGGAGFPACATLSTLYILVMLQLGQHALIASPPQPGETGAAFQAPREGHYSARIVRARLIIGQSKVDGFKHLVHFAV